MRKKRSVVVRFRDPRADVGRVFLIVLVMLLAFFASFLGIDIAVAAAGIGYNKLL